MKSNALISVIVPVYNVERYLDRCVQSILKQTYENIEIILVDDGSPDSCPRMCDEYAAKNGNIKVIHKENGGLSSARNAGMLAAQGKYIGFVDSDDWVEADMYEYLLNIIRSNEADGAQISLQQANSIYPAAVQPAEEVRVYEEKDILQSYMMSTTRVSGGYSVCRCLFQRSVLSELFFREGKINEDVDFKYKALAKCRRFVVSNQIKYYYYQSTESITTDGLKQRDFDLYDAAEELCRLTANETYGDIRFLGEVKKARTAFSLLSKIAYYGISDPNIDREKTIRDLTAEHRHNLPILLRAPLPFSRKVLSVMFALNFGMTEVAVHIARRIGKLVR